MVEVVQVAVDVAGAAAATFKVLLGAFARSVTVPVKVPDARALMVIWEKVTANWRGINRANSSP